MKKLPIGIQNIREMLTEDYVYVDKTNFAKQLIQTGKHYFLSRPRRFGKSLFLNTLEEIFKGNKELFKGYHIYQSDYDWQAYPVLYFDFAQILTNSPQDLKDSLKRRLANLATEHETSIEIPSAQEGLANLVKALSKKNRLVLALVDEYDSPIINNLKTPEVAEQNRDVLKEFFGTLKSLDRYLKFTFVTGVSKFAQVSLFSGPNHLTDITMDTRYTAMMGYTQEELTGYFEEHIQAIAKKRQNQGKQTTQQDILLEIRAWYNGYRFSEEDLAVYNPYSTLRFLDTAKPKSYWYSSGTPSFLIDQVKKHPEGVIPLAGVTAKESKLMDMSSLTEIDLKALMFQTGYLTIEGYHPASKHYQLGFPNQEVREAFMDSLVEQFASIDAQFSAQCSEALKAQTLTPFFDKLKVSIASFPYQLFTQAQERTYHSILLALMTGMDLQVAAENPTHLGRVDLLVEMPQTTYLIELKVDSSPEAALEQIKQKQYFVPCLNKGKEVAIVGLNITSKQRNTAGWLGELLDASGKKIRDLKPDEKDSSTPQLS